MYVCAYIDFFLYSQVSLLTFAFLKLSHLLLSRTAVIGDVVRALPCDGLADINDERTSTSPTNLAKIGIEKSPKWQGKVQKSP